MKRTYVLMAVLCVLLLTGGARAAGETVERDCVAITALYAENGKFLDAKIANFAAGDAVQPPTFDSVPADAGTKTFLLDASNYAPYTPAATPTVTPTPPITTPTPAPAGNVYALLYDDGTLVFQSTNTPDNSRGSVTNTYEVNLQEHYTAYWDDDKETNVFTVPWHDECESITTVEFAASIAPVSTAYWFYDCIKLTEIKHIDRLNTSNVTDMNNMFCSCYHLTPLDVSGFDTSNVTDISYMFAQCYDLTELDVSGWDTSNVTDISYMFAFCKNLTELDVSGWDTSNVTDMYQVFYACDGLTTLDVSNWDTSNATSSWQMFAACDNLTTIYASEKFTLNPEVNSDYMFENSESLVGGKGTVYDENHVDGEYARIDNPPSAPGYFTRKA